MKGMNRYPADERLYVKYKTVTGLLNEAILEDPDMHLKEMSGYLAEKWKESHQDDYEKGNTSIGPHKDDLELSLDGDGLGHLHLRDSRDPRHWRLNWLNLKSCGMRQEKCPCSFWMTYSANLMPDEEPACCQIWLTLRCLLLVRIRR